MAQQTYNNIVYETDCDPLTAQNIIDELIKRRVFIKGAESAVPEAHNPSFFHLQYKDLKLSVLVERDADGIWHCSIFSVKAFSSAQPPRFVIE